MSLADFHFIRPWWLLALLPWLVLLWQQQRRRRSGGAWASVCDPALRPFVLTGGAGRGRERLPGLLGAVAAVLIVALAGPAWERLPTPVFRDPSALVIALDLSRSMHAADVEPSRLVRARFKVADIIERRRNGQTALLVFAAEPFVVTPLTDDTRTIASQLPALSPELMPAQGSRPDLAIARAAELIEQAGLRTGDVLLVTDDVPDQAFRAALEQVQSLPLRLSVLGVGSLEGAPVPRVTASGFMSDDRGNLVTSRLAEDRWRELAAAGAGMYRRLRGDERDTDALLAFFEQRIVNEDIEQSNRVAPTWRDRGPWLVVAMLPLAALAFRRGLVFMLLAGVLAAGPARQAEAFEWQDLWLRPDQRGAEALSRGDAEAAAGLFRDPRWEGAARYRSGDYEAAAEALRDRQDTTSQYNLGNALAQQGRFEEALEQWDSVLEQDPDNEDARFNAGLVRELLKQQQQQQQQSSQNSDEQQREGEQEQQSSGNGDQEQEQQEQSGQSQQDQSGQPEEQQGRQDAAGEDSDPDDAQRNPGQEPPDPADEQERREQEAREAERREQEQARRQQALAEQDETSEAERAQAVEQWLRRIPDDPGGLLRRKFLYQYRQLPQRRQEGQQW